MELLEEAGLPPGVINMLPGDGIDVSEVALAHPDLAGIHFTGSTPIFQHLWQHGRREHRGATAPTRGSSARPAARTSSSPTPRADPDVLRTALIRGAFEYQGQKCSAASRAYVARSRSGAKMRDQFVAEVEALTMGDVTDFSNFMGAVIDDRAFAKHKAAITRAKRQQPRCRSWPAAGRRLGRLLRAADRRAVRPTRRTRCSPPSTSARSWPSTSTTTADYDAGRSQQMESVAPYALTGSIIAQDRRADRRGAATSCGSRPATSTSTTSRPARSSASSRSAAPGPRAPTTRPAPRRT